VFVNATDGKQIRFSSKTNLLPFELSPQEKHFPFEAPELNGWVKLPASFRRHFGTDTG